MGKVSRVEQADRDPNPGFSQPPPAPGTEVPDLGASGTLKHRFGTSYLAGPSGTALKVDVTATMTGSNDHGSAEVSSGVTKVNSSPLDVDPPRDATPRSMTTAGNGRSPDNGKSRRYFAFLAG